MAHKVTDKITYSAFLSSYRLGKELFAIFSFITQGNSLLGQAQFQSYLADATVQGRWHLFSVICQVSMWSNFIGPIKLSPHLQQDLSAVGFCITTFKELKNCRKRFPLKHRIARNVPVRLEWKTSCHTSAEKSGSPLD